MLVLDKGHLKHKKPHTIRSEPKVIEHIPLSQIKQEMPRTHHDMTTLTHSRPSQELAMKKDDSVCYLKNPNFFMSGLNRAAVNTIVNTKANANADKSFRSKSMSKFYKIKSKARISNKRKKFRKTKSNNKSKSKSPMRQPNLKHLEC